MIKFNKHELELLYLAEAIQQVDPNAILTGSLNLKLKGYKLIKPCDDIDILFSIDNNFDTEKMNSRIDNLCEKLGLEIVDNGEIYEEEDLTCVTLSKQDIKIHVMFEKVASKMVFVNEFPYNGTIYYLRLTHNILAAKICHFYHGGSDKHLKQLIKTTRQLKRGFIEKQTGLYGIRPL